MKYKGMLKTSRPKKVGNDLCVVPEKTYVSFRKRPMCRSDKTANYEQKLKGRFKI